MSLLSSRDPFDSSGRAARFLIESDYRNRSVSHSLSELNSERAIVQPSALNRSPASGWQAFSCRTGRQNTSKLHSLPADCIPRNCSRRFTVSGEIRPPYNRMRVVDYQDTARRRRRCRVFAVSGGTLTVGQSAKISSFNNNEQVLRLFVRIDALRIGKPNKRPRTEFVLSLPLSGADRTADEQGSRRAVRHGGRMEIDASASHLQSHRKSSVQRGGERIPRLLVMTEQAAKMAEHRIRVNNSEHCFSILIVSEFASPRI